MKFLLLAVSFLSLVPSAFAAGQHRGEKDQVAYSIQFEGDGGWFTTTDARGIYYHYPGGDPADPSGVFAQETKVYPPATYGRVFPLFFVGDTMRFTVTLTATGNKPFKLRVRALHSVLEESGQPGQAMGPAQEWEVDLARGETKTVSGSLFLDPAQDLPSGLDVTRVQIFHRNQGNPAAGFIDEQVGVWCPPAVRPR